MGKNSQQRKTDERLASLEIGPMPSSKMAQHWFCFTYGEVKETVASKGTEAKASRDLETEESSKILSLWGEPKAARLGRKPVCVSELRQGGKTVVKHFEARVADLNGYTETLAAGVRVNGRMPRPQDLDFRLASN